MSEAKQPIEVYQGNISHMISEHAALMAEDEEGKKQMYAYLCQAARKNGKLLTSNVIKNGSLAASILDLMSVGLPPDGKNAYIVTYGDEAHAGLMYQGAVRLFSAAYPELTLVAEVIYSNDQFTPPRTRIVNGHVETEFSYSKASYLPTHRPDAKNPIEQFGIVASICYVMDKKSRRLVGKIEMIDATELKSICLKSRGKNPDEPSPAWKSFPGEQAKKTVIHRFLKTFAADGTTPALVDARLKHLMQMHEKEYDLDVTPPTGPSPSFPEMPVSPEQGGHQAAIEAKNAASVPPEKGDKQDDKQDDKPKPVPAKNTNKGKGEKTAGKVQPGSDLSDEERKRFKALYTACKTNDLDALKRIQFSMSAKGIKKFSDLKTKEDFQEAAKIMTDILGVAGIEVEG